MVILSMFLDLTVWSAVVIHWTVDLVLSPGKLLQVRLWPRAVVRYCPVTEAEGNAVEG